MRPTFVAFALTASLLASSPGHLGFLDQLWAHLSDLWTGSTIEEGCGWDPNGVCRVGQDAAEEGCGWDPSGRCGGGASQAAPDEGCGWDPFGCPGS